MWDGSDEIGKEGVRRSWKERMEWKERNGIGRVDKGWQGTGWDWQS